MSDAKYSTANSRKQCLEVAERFLQQLRPNGPWMLLGILPDEPPSKSISKIIVITAHTIAEAQQFVGEHNGTRNLYYSVNPTKHDMDKKASKIDIAAIEYCLADLDPKKDEKSEIEELRRKVETIGLPKDA